MSSFLAGVVALSSILLSTGAQADEPAPIVVTLENHIFTPSEIHIPAHTKAVIIVKNNDATAEEFESGALKIEKVVAAHSQGEIHVRPSEHGHYTFVGEYHEKVARGVIVVD
jgi:heme/copper-type cytochrome/quinol oxidase subunit 2